MKYNPIDFNEFKGKSFISKNESYYSISQDGRILGRPSIEGAKLLYVAGVDIVGYWSLSRYLEDFNKDNFDRTILEIGGKPKSELHLVVSLTPDASKEKNRNGLITSRIIRIEDLV